VHLTVFMLCTLLSYFLLPKCRMAYILLVSFPASVCKYFTAKLDLSIQISYFAFSVLTHFIYPEQKEF
jgi:hypothetical protein